MEQPDAKPPDRRMFPSEGDGVGSGSMESPVEPVRNRRRLVLRVTSLVLWGLVLALFTVPAVREPSAGRVMTAVLFWMLFVAAHAQLVAVRWAGQRQARRLTAKLRTSGYLSDDFDLPNRNYLLAELRREMPHAREHGTPFTLIVLSLDDFEGVRERRGDEFAQRARRVFADLLQRITRGSDFLAHLGGASFAVLLTECGEAEAFRYLQRVPGTIGVSDGRRVYDVGVIARVATYDMESLYATDVLRAAEEATPLRRREEPRPWAEAA